MTTDAAAPATRRVRRPGDTTITYSVTGPPDGPVWVFVHGWGCRRTDFGPLAGFLPPGVRTIAVDLPGHGESRSARTGWTIDEFARDVAAVLDAESVARCTMVGHSLGGAVALVVAGSWPGTVDRVIGLDSFHFLVLFPAADEDGVRAVTASLRADFPGALRVYNAQQSGPDADPAFEEEIFRKMSAGDPAVLIAALEGLLRWDMDAALAATGVPVVTLAVRRLLDPAAVDRYRDRITFVVVESGGHHFLLERPEATARLLVEAAGPEYGGA